MIYKSLIICYSTPNYESLTHIFKSSLLSIGIKEDNICHKLDIPKEELMSKEGFQTNLWYYCLLSKIKHLIDTLEKEKEKNINNSYEYYVFSDCDIFYMKQNKQEWDNLESYIINTENQIYFMQDEGFDNVNSGFFVIKKNYIEEAIAFFKEVYITMGITKKSDMQFGDQTIINNLKHKINYGLIPNEYVIYGKTIYNKKKALFHHAVSVGSIKGKIKQIINTILLCNK
jgi:hypothetical protein